MIDPLVVGVLLRCHARARTLDIKLTEYERLNNDLASILFRVSIWADRPTAPVRDVLARHSRSLHCVQHSPFPLVGLGRERFMEAANEQLRQLRASCRALDWLSLSDDDSWLEPMGARRELPAALANRDVDVWSANTLFFHDYFDTLNLSRHHCSPLFFRNSPDDWFPTNRITNATEGLNDDAIIHNRVRVLDTPLLDYGTFTHEDRARVHAAYLTAGKDDDFTRSAAPSATPMLGKVANHLHHPWRDLFSESLKAKPNGPQ